MKKWILGLMGLVAIALIISGVACGKKGTIETPAVVPPASIIGTYVWDKDPRFYIELEKDGKFSFKGWDKLYLGTWELKDSDLLMLHFPPGSVSFAKTSKGVDWKGMPRQNGLEMEPDLGSRFLGTSISNVYFLRK